MEKPAILQPETAGFRSCIVLNIIKNEGFFQCPSNFIFYLAVLYSARLFTYALEENEYWTVKKRLQGSPKSIDVMSHINPEFNEIRMAMGSTVISGHFAMDYSSIDLLLEENQNGEYIHAEGEMKFTEPQSLAMKTLLDELNLSSDETIQRKYQALLVGAMVDSVFIEILLQAYSSEDFEVSMRLSGFLGFLGGTLSAVFGGIASVGSSIISGGASLLSGIGGVIGGVLQSGLGAIGSIGSTIGGVVFLSTLVLATFPLIFELRCDIFSG